ncbi:MAG: hypothetical protein ACE5F9_07160 [Phycisphaerae bacterium]
MAVGAFDILAQGLTTVREETRVELARWSTGNALLVGALVAAVVLYAVAWMYRREGRGAVSRRLRWALVGCRVSVLLLLGVIGLEPVLTKYLHRKLDAYTLVLVDASASMGLTDRYREDADATRVEKALGRLRADGVRRAALVEHVVNVSGGHFLRDLAARNHVRVLAFGDGVEPQGFVPFQGDAGERPPPDIPPLHLSPTGRTTDVGLAIRSAVDAAGGSPVAAVVVLSDGGFNIGEDPQVVARFLKRKNIPLYAVGIGDPAEPINVRITDIAAPRSAFKNDPFTVTVRLDAEGVGAEAIHLELLERDAAGSEPAQVVAERTVRLGPDGRPAPVVFERKVSEPGTLTYVARVRPLPFEVVRSDNRREILPAVRILDDRMRVLLIAGAPSFDYRYLTRMLERDETVDLSTWLQSADVHAIRDGNTIITELPTDSDELYAYDAILFLDATPREFDATWGSLVATFVVDRGGGVLYAAGNKNTGAFFRSPKAASIVELLPIVPDPDAEILLNELGHFQTRAWPLVIPDAAAADPILRLAEDPVANRALWSSLEGVYWHYPVRRAKPIASVLLRHSNPRMVNSFGPHVLFATQFVGAGRAAYLGINTTWRWRRGDETPFNRFWIQTLRYLVEGKLLGGRRRGRITTERTQYHPGESVVVTAQTLNERFEPLDLPALELTVTRRAAAAEGDEPESEAAAGPRTVTLEPMPGRDGVYQGRFVPGEIGTLRLAMELPGAGASPIEKDILVTASDVEMRRPAMQRGALRAFAAAAGGRYLDVDEASRIAELVPDSSRTFVTRERPRALWDNGTVLAVLVALLTIEWILRKRAKLL